MDGEFQFIAVVEQLQDITHSSQGNVFFDWEHFSTKSGIKQDFRSKIAIWLKFLL